MHRLGSVDIGSLGDNPDAVCPDFYQKQDTPLAALVDKIAGREGHTAILVSDLVQSEPTGDTQGRVAALTKLTVKRPEIRLLSFRSDLSAITFRRRTVAWDRTGGGAGQVIPGCL